MSKNGIIEYNFYFYNALELKWFEHYNIFLIALYAVNKVQD